MIKLNYPNFWQKRTWLSYLMLPLAAIYTFAAKLRYISIKPIKLPGKVICIGNLTVGGTGKTQAIIAIAKQLTKKQIKFVIISKGYGGKFKSPMQVDEDMDPTIVGDEALELCRHGLTIVSRKVTDSIPLLKAISPDVILVDDGAQNPSFLKDFTIITIDSNRGFGNGFPIPSGPMRQPNIIEQVDAILLITDKNIPLALNIDKFITTASISPIDKLSKDKKYYAFAGIGNPEKFFDLLKTQGLEVIKTTTFPDHYAYTHEDIIKLEKEAGYLLSTLTTTSKDYVKIPNRTNIICYNVELIIQDEAKLMEKIYEKIS